MWMFALCGHAQQISGSIAGRLIDQQGAVISSAAVTITEPSKNVTITAKTNESGTFVFPALQPGSYTISASAPGFKKLEKTHITLDANDKLALGDGIDSIPRASPRRSRAASAWNRASIPYTRPASSTSICRSKSNLRCANA
jgi:hypothetical protein